VLTSHFIITPNTFLSQEKDAYETVALERFSISAGAIFRNLSTDKGRKGQFGRHRHRWEDNIKMDLK